MTLMNKRIALLVAAAAMALSTATFAPTSTGTVLAASPSQQCADSGGTYSKDGGKSTCKTTTTTSPGKNRGGVTDTTTTTTTGQGNLTNKQTSGDTKCRGTKGSTRC